MYELHPKSHSKFGISVDSGVQQVAKSQISWHWYRAPRSSANKVYLRQGYVHNLSQEQLYAHRTRASPLLHICFKFWI